MAKPIQVVQDDDPSQEEIDRIHTLMMEAMTDLFDKHKASYGWADKKLIIK